MSRHTLHVTFEADHEDHAISVAAHLVALLADAQAPATVEIDTWDVSDPDDWAEIYPRTHATARRAPSLPLLTGLLRDVFYH